MGIAPIQVLHCHYHYLYVSVPTPPDLSTCRVAVTDSQGVSTNSTTTGALTHCPNQRNESVNTLPAEVYFVVKAGLDKTLNYQDSYVKQAQFGVVGMKIEIIKLSAQGTVINLVVMIIELVSCSYYMLGGKCGSLALTGNDFVTRGAITLKEKIHRMKYVNFNCDSNDFADFTCY